MTEILQSLSAFCKAHGIPKSTASRRLKELGVDARDGLDSNGVAKLRELYGLDKAKENTQLAVANTSMTSLDFAEFMGSLNSEIEYLDAEFVDDAEDSDALIRQLSDQEKQLEEAEDMIAVMRGKTRAVRHFQLEKSGYSGEMLRQRQQDVLANAQSSKNRNQKNIKKPQRPQPKKAVV